MASRHRLAVPLGGRHRQWGEVPVAVVVLRKNAVLKPKDVLSLFEGRIARFIHPRVIVFRHALPHNAMGKVLKYKLREEYETLDD
ncbi:MAG: hypothetical protein QF787_17115 [Nitrospinota bacterium]|nr:hypothetical protein [Nitrospinota bacterium]